VLLGLGGCGKSHLALAFCQQAERSGEYGHILWVDATSPTSASQSFTTFAQEIMEHEVDITNEAENIRFVLTRLAAAEQPWLLVFDNFDNPSSFSDKHINEYFPRQRQNGSIIITSRHASTRDLGSSIDLTTMRKEEALKLLLQRSKTEKTEYNVLEGQRIIEKLGYHALSIDQAGAYILRGANLDLYMTHYDKHRKQLMREVPAFTAYERKLEGNFETGTPLPVFTTWELSLALIRGNEKTKEDTRHFITLLAFFNGSDISSEPFETYGSTHADWMSSCLADGDWDKLKFEDILRELKDLSLLQSLEITTSSIRFSLHPLIQDWTKLRIGIEARQAFTIEAVLILGDFLRAHYPYRMALDTKQSTLLHLDATLHNCREHLKKEYWSLTDLPNSFAQIAKFYHGQGRYYAAEETSHRALEGRKVLLGLKHPSTLMSMNNLGEALSNQGKYVEAETMHRQTLALREEVLGPEHLATLTSMSNLASVLSHQGKYSESEIMNRQILALREKVLGPGHPSTLTSISNLALALSDQGKYAEAEKMHRQASVLQGSRKRPKEGIDFDSYLNGIIPITIVIT
jgi:tetratricopeptide (TPR) repeat protein